MRHFEIIDTPICGLKVIRRLPRRDDRGFLERLFCYETAKTLLSGKTIRQINHTLTRKAGTVRGLHFQYPPYAETKVVSCLKGEIWDVVVDLRKGSPTFLRHHAVNLSENNFQSFLVPEGVAHGFQTLTSDCEMLYLHTADYNAAAEGALNALDPRLAIDWPLPITEVSERDGNHAMLAKDFEGMEA